MDLTADLYGFTEEEHTRVFYGANAEKHLGKLILQDTGGGVTAVVGFMCNEIHKTDQTHELLVGHFIFKPVTRFATNSLRGMGLAGLVTDGGLFEKNYEYRYENGILVPNK